METPKVYREYSVEELKQWSTHALICLWVNAKYRVDDKKLRMLIRRRANNVIRSRTRNAK